MPKLTDQQRAELEALKAMPDEQIEFSDIPEREIDWSKARRGMFYQPAWKEITLQLEEYVIEWFEENYPDDETHTRRPIRRPSWDTSSASDFPTGPNTSTRSPWARSSHKHCSEVEMPIRRIPALCKHMPVLRNEPS